MCPASQSITHILEITERLTEFSQQMSFKLQKGPKSTHRQRLHTIFWAQNSQKLFYLHSSRTRLSQSKKDSFYIPKTREPQAMPHYRPCSSFASLALPQADRGEEPIPALLSTSSNFSTQIPGEQQTILCLSFMLYPASSIFPLVASMTTPYLCCLPPFDLGNQSCSICFQSATQSKQLGPSLALCRGSLLYDTPVTHPIPKHQITCVRHEEWLPSEPAVVLKRLSLSEVATFSKSLIKSKQFRP